MAYNTTQLHPAKTFEKHVYHRDQFAHYLRWSHVVKNLRIGMSVLDVGCADAGLLEVMYRNCFKGRRYLGLEFRANQVAANANRYENVEWAEFKQWDITKAFPSEAHDQWDIIACFEVLEHIGRANVTSALTNIADVMVAGTKLMISTPIYDEKVGAADNHIIDGAVGEMTYEELAGYVEAAGLKVVKTFGTFASIKDYKPLMNGWQAQMFDALNEYYDTNLLSNLMAPLFPKQSRNCLWILSK